MTIRIVIKGIKETNEKLRKLTAEKLQNADNATKQAGFFIEGEVKASIAGQRAELTSVDTGRFLNSVNTAFPKQLVASVQSDVEYAKFLEYGTTKLAPRHHFTNSANRNKDKVREFIAKSIK